MVATPRYLALAGLLSLTGCAAVESVLGSEAVALPPPALLAVAAAGDDMEDMEDVAGVGSAITRSPDGLFYVDALVNGATVRFVVDSGSSLVVLTKEDAARARLGSSGTAGGLMRTAGGVTRMRHATIASLKVADRSLPGVEAAVVDDLPGVSLMGQSALGRLELVAFRRDRLHLR